MGGLDERVAALILGLTAALSMSLVFGAPQLARTVSEQPGRVATLLALTLLMQLCSVQVYGRGSVSVSAIGILTSAFLLNTGTAMGIALAAAAAQWLRRRGQLYKGAFDAANFALSAAASSLIFHALPQSRFAAAVLAGIAYAAINNGVLCLAMSLSEELSWTAVWRERFNWARYHFALFGPVALAGAIAYEQIGVAGLAAFAVPPALMILSVRQYLERTTSAVEKIRQANLELRRAHRDTIAALSRSIEAKDAYTGGHTERVAAIAVELARELGYENDDLEAIEIGALLHDIGKIGVPEHVIRKPGPLDEDEWKVMRTHPIISDSILSELDLRARPPPVRQAVRALEPRADRRRRLSGSAHRRGDSAPCPHRLRRRRLRRPHHESAVPGRAPAARGARRDSRARRYPVLPPRRRRPRQALEQAPGSPRRTLGGAHGRRRQSAMRLGDHVIWQDRVYVLRGFEPMSVPDGRAELADPSSGERIFVPADELRSAPSSHE